MRRENRKTRDAFVAAVEESEARVQYEKSRQQQAFLKFLPVLKGITLIAWLSAAILSVILATLVLIGLFLYPFVTICLVCLLGSAIWIISVDTASHRKMNDMFGFYSNTLNSNFNFDVIYWTFFFTGLGWTLLLCPDSFLVGYWWMPFYLRFLFITFYIVFVQKVRTGIPLSGIDPSLDSKFTSSVTCDSTRGVHSTYHQSSARELESKKSSCSGRGCNAHSVSCRGAR